MLRRGLVLLALLASLAAAAPAMAGTLGLGESYNALIFGSYSAKGGSVEGTVAVGGDAYAKNHSIASGLSNDRPGAAGSLIVGGDLTYHSGRVEYGDILVGGSGDGVTTSVRNGLAHDGLSLRAGLGTALPVDFAAEQARLTTLSQNLADLVPTGTDQVQYGGLYFTGDGSSSLQVFDIAGSDLSSTTWGSLSGVPTGATIIVNVSGETISWSGGLPNIFESYADKVLFNFYEATSITLSSIGVRGSILAPTADIVVGKNGGEVYGQIVANSLTFKNFGLHYSDFTGYLPDFGGIPAGSDLGAEVPEPGVLALFGTGLAAFWWLRRRRA